MIFESILCNLKPALRIRNILAVLLGYLRYIAAQSKRSDGHNRVVGRPGYFLLGGHFIAQGILINLVGINIRKVIALHDFVGNSHILSPMV